MLKKVAILFVIAFTLNSCVSKKVYQELETKFNKLRTSNSELIKEKDDLHTTISVQSIKKDLNLGRLVFCEKLGKDFKVGENLINLSSKEIAPLLNISPRSVEVKRYRLRKKMELPHDSNLTSYIIEL